MIKEFYVLHIFRVFEKKGSMKISLFLIYFFPFLLGHSCDNEGNLEFNY